MFHALKHDAHRHTKSMHHYAAKSFILWKDDTYMHVKGYCVILAAVWKISETGLPEQLPIPPVQAKAPP
jgi:hypothetical protein